MNKNYIFRVMKLVILLLLGGFLHLSAASYSQTVTLKGKYLPLAEVLQAVRKQTGYGLVGNMRMLEDSKSVTVSATDMPLEEFLKTVFRDQPLGYRLVEKNIMLERKNKSLFARISHPEQNESRPEMAKKNITITGRVTDTTGAALPGATITIKGQTNNLLTDKDGQFTFSAQSGSEVTVTFIGFTPYTFKVTENLSFQNIVLRTTSSKLNEVVIVNTGYQTLPKERATGSFSFVDNITLNRTVGPDILSRLKGVTSGLLFDPNTSSLSGDGTLGINIRGRSTIYSNADPIIVLDNFIYDGDLTNINPNAIEDITVLKDAAAASIWGAKAANGVIVITSKKGKYNQSVSIEVNFNISIIGKPDLSYSPILNSKDYIQIEKYLFNNGYYDPYIDDSYSVNAFTPAINAMIENRKGNLSNLALQEELNKFGEKDVKTDFSKYLFRKSVIQQYSATLRGGDAHNRYFIFGGYDKSLSNLRGDDNNRITFNATNNYSFAKEKLELTTNLVFTKVKNKNNGITPNSISQGSGILYPYASLADENGQALKINKYISPLIDTVGQGKLLDWSYRPLDELDFADNVTKNVDYKLNFGLLYHITKNLSADLKYQYSKGENTTDNFYSENTYFTRDYINGFSSINADGSVNRPVPLGAILDKQTNSYTGQHGRFQINYDQSWDKHWITGIAGAEVNNISTNEQSSRFYAFDKEHLSSVPNLDYVSYYINPVTGYNQQISNKDGLSELNDRFVSYFGNVAYSYLSRYTFSLSGRKDGANIFGVNANQKIAPFWSSGFSWDLSREPFYHLNWLPSIKVRTTYGYNGNVNRRIAALLTTQLGTVTRYGQQSSSVVNPPNPDLRWETSKQFNFGFDFSILNNERVFGSLDYYKKKGVDLIGDAVLPPSSGFSSYRGNTSDMKGYGFDFVINAKAIDERFKWLSSIQFSISKNQITDYKLDPVSNGDIVAGSPVVGKPVGSLFSYKWKGLDPSNGDPQGYLNGEISKNYTSIINSLNSSELVYSGSQLPPVFGNFMNTFSFQNISLSANITYKFGYFFRKPSISYTDVFNGSTLGNNDYEKRWQQAGDEKATHVPSMVYPGDFNRDVFYQLSEALIDKGDHIRLKDIRVSYDLNKKQYKRLPFESLQIYLIGDNIGILWRANKDHVDPDQIPGYGYSYLIPFTISGGVKVNF
ncbi:TonB-linked outer membrane protein, SusC/RagA family [bacterium A37T11]|nr:TonB-linked outer membrane protein, SusC/RagA family [bacterium A37T11]